MRPAMLVAVGLLVIGASGCGDECDTGYVDTFGLCLPDGLAYWQAEAVVSSIINLRADLPENATSPCDGGGTVTVASGPCPTYPCVEETDYTFNNCTVVHNASRDLSLHFASGTFHDSSISMVVDGKMMFSHKVTGNVTMGGEVYLKAAERSFAVTPCAMDFSENHELLQTVKTITGTMCGASIELPLYLAD